MTLPVLRGAWAQTQSFLRPRQAFYLLPYIPALTLTLNQTVIFVSLIASAPLLSLPLQTPLVIPYTPSQIHGL